MKKLLLTICCLLIGGMSAQSASKTIKRTFPKEAGSIEFVGNFENGELMTGPIIINYKSYNRNRETRALLKGDYNAATSEFIGTFYDPTYGGANKLSCHCIMSNNETRDKILVKNLKQDKWDISIEELFLSEYENKGDVRNVKLLIGEEYIQSLYKIAAAEPTDESESKQLKMILEQQNLRAPKKTGSTLGVFCQDFESVYVEITFKNGNKCIGPQDRHSYNLIRGGNSTYEYIWSNGDKYIGSISPYGEGDGLSKYKQIRPAGNSNRGAFILTNGSKILPDSSVYTWHPSVAHEEERINTTPTESFKVALKKIEEQKQKEEAERLRKIREEEERKAAELRAKQEEEAKKIARKNELIRKYGQKYGEAIYNGEPKTGMTIEMVQDMHQKRGHMTRRISNGNEITVLSYGGDYVSLFGISGITASYRYTFVNGRLTDFTSTDAQASIDWL